jgi:hypothetical protein
MQETILEYVASGLSVIPTHPVLKNPRIGSWTVFQTDRPTPEQVKKWFSNGNDYSPGIITGTVSGNLELLDFDENARQFHIWKELVHEQLPGFVDTLVQQTTQNGGIHVVYRCPDIQIPGNKKLSTGAIEVDGPGEHQHGNKGYRAIQYRGKWVITPTLIETRGNGGYFLASPGKGYQLVCGSFLKISSISASERKILFDCAEILTEYEKEIPVVGPPSAPREHSGCRPGDAFNSSVTIQSLLRENGWRQSNRQKSMPDGTTCEMWVRPGKERGVSATVYDNKVHVFSSNATPLEPRVTYDPFAFYTTIYHFGNWAASATDLLAKGYGVSESKQQEARVSGSKQGQNSVSECKQQEARGKREVSEGGKSVSEIEVGVPLAIAIKEHVEQYTGIFSVYDIDREFALFTREEKNNRSKILNKLAKECKIKKIAGKVGYWKTVDGCVKSMKLGSTSVAPLDITLPLGLSDLAQILPGNIILVAGAPNGGKTAFLMRSLYTLLKNNKNIKDCNNGAIGTIKTTPLDCGVSIRSLMRNGVRYLNSEMDETELTDRCASFPNGLEIFSTGCEFVQRYRDFADVIIPNGINFIDFLEIHEDFFELGKLINEIFESLTTGLCFIACQKKQGADYAKGGSSSLEKPRLVVNLDRNEGFGKICKIVKCKKTTKPGENHDGKEVDFDIDGQMNFTRYSTWRYVNEKQRLGYNRDYEARGLKIIPEKDYSFMFRLKDGSLKGVLPNQVAAWEEKFIGVDVRGELEKIEEQSRNRPFLDDNWFFVLPGILNKRLPKQGH